MKFKEYLAFEFCDSVRDGTHDSPKKVDKGYKLITSRHIKNNSLIKEEAYCISKEDYDEINKRSKVEINDILFSMIGTVGLIYREKNNVDYAIKNIGLFKMGNDEIKSKWLYYYLQSPEMKNYTNSLLVGSTQQYITLNSLRNLIVKYPNDKKYAQKVNTILSTIDSKIELNNKINDNLFNIIKQYIKENFYNNENIKQLEVKEFGNIQGGYAFKSNDLLDQKTKNKIFKIKNISNNGVDIENTQCVNNEIAEKVDSKFLLTRGDVILAMTGAELGKTGFLYGTEYNYYINQRVGVVRGKDAEKTLYLNCIFLLDKFQSILNSKGYGSAQPNISTSDIEKIEIPIPDEEQLKEFYKITYPIYNKVILKSEENIKLRKLHDTLLPKLMNGEIDLDKIEI